MRFPRFALGIALIGTAIHTLRSEDSAAESEGVWTVAPTLVSQYLFRGVQLAGPSFQPSVDYTSGAFSGGIWTSAALQHRVRGDSDPEVDLYGSYNFAMAGGKLSLVPGFYLYTYPDAKHSNGLYPATFEPSLAAVFSVAGVQLTPKVYYDLMLDGATAELSAAMAWPLKSFGTELDFSASVGTFRTTDSVANADPAVKNWGDYWLVGVSLPAQVSMHSKIILNLTYSEGRNNFHKEGTLPKAANGDAGRHVAVSLTYATTF